MQRTVINLGLDNGSGNLQLVTSTTRFLMENKIDEDRVLDKELSRNENSFNVIYKDKQYLVGAAANNPTGQVEGKHTERHLISMLTAFTQSIPNNSIVNMATGESMDKYFNAKHKEMLINKFTGDHEIIVDGKTYNYTIQKVHVLPEGIGHKLLAPGNYKGRITWTVDLGASTANFLYCNGLLPDEAYSKSFQLGMHKLVSNIKTAISRNGYGKSVPTKNVDNYIKNGCNIPEIQEIINQEVFTLLETFHNSLVTTIDLDDVFVEEIEFLGGTSIRLQQYIKQRYEKAIFIENGMWTNAEGFAKFAIAKFSK